MTKQEEHIAVTPTKEDSSIAIISMVLGIVSLTGPGLLLGIPAIVTGIIAIRKKVANRGLAIAGRSRAFGRPWSASIGLFAYCSPVCSAEGINSSRTRG